MVINAFKIAKENIKMLKLLLVGKGQLKESIKKKIKEYNLEKSIHMLGLRNDIFKLLLISDIVILPSIYEGVPMITLEAMIAKKAIIATAVGGIPEIIDNNESGILINKNDISLLLMKLLVYQVIKKREYY